MRNLSSRDILCGFFAGWGIVSLSGSTGVGRQVVLPLLLPLVGIFPTDKQITIVARIVILIILLPSGGEGVSENYMSDISFFFSSNQMNFLKKTI